jgi:hypothetical protein
VAHDIHFFFVIGPFLLYCTAYGNVFVNSSWRATRLEKSEGISVMLVSYVQGAEGNKGVSYYNATL